MQKGILELAAFISGLIVLALEVLAFRMFAPYFGYSVFVSGTLIGTVLIALAIGYYEGGVLADKKPKPGIVFILMMVSGIYILLDVFAYKIVLAFLSGMEIISGTLVSSIIILAAPMILLSMVSPFIVRLTAKDKVGLAAGRVSALGTIGAIIGSFLTTFYLIPVAGVFITLVTFTCALLIFSMIILGAQKKKYFIIILFLFIIPFSLPSVRGNGIMLEKDSIYNTIKIVEMDDQKYLILNNEQWIQSIYSEDELNEMNRYYFYMNAGPIIADADNVLILGFGAGTSAQQLRRYFPGIKIDGVEIDPDVVELSYQYFGIQRDDPDMAIYVEDARRFLQTASKEYDFIELDIYQGGPFIPYYMVTSEAFESMRNVMTERGLLIMNVLSLTGSGKRNVLVDNIGYTISKVFPSVYKIDLGSNTLLIATKQGTTRNQIKEKLSGNTVEGLGEMTSNMNFLIEDFKPVSNVTNHLTDDLAPIEQLTFEMLNA